MRFSLFRPNQKVTSTKFARIHIIYSWRTSVFAVSYHLSDIPTRNSFRIPGYFKQPKESLQTQHNNCVRAARFSGTLIRIIRVVTLWNSFFLLVINKLVVMVPPILTVNEYCGNKLFGISFYEWFLSWATRFFAWLKVSIFFIS